MPLYWEKRDDEFWAMTLHGAQRVDLGRTSGPRELLRGRRFRNLGRTTSPNGSGVGTRSGVSVARGQFRRFGSSTTQSGGVIGRRSAPDVRGRLGVDSERFLALPAVSCGRRRRRRVQRQIHVWPVCVAWRLLRDTAGPYSTELSELLSPGRAMAVLRVAASGGHVNARNC